MNYSSRIFWTETAIITAIFNIYMLGNLASHPAHADMGGNGTVVLVAFILSAIYGAIMTAVWFGMKQIVNPVMHITISITAPLIVPVLIFTFLLLSSES
jgi:hypothetical protein